MLVVALLHCFLLQFVYYCWYDSRYHLSLCEYGSGIECDSVKNVKVTENPFSNTSKAKRIEILSYYRSINIWTWI